MNQASPPNKNTQVNVLAAATAATKSKAQQSPDKIKIGGLITTNGDNSSMNSEQLGDQINQNLHGNTQVYPLSPSNNPDKSVKNVDRIKFQIKLEEAAPTKNKDSELHSQISSVFQDKNDAR